MILSYRVLL